MSMRIAGVPVTIYQGQLDLICCTLGVETWLQRLKWPGMAAFNAAPHEPFYAHGHKDTAGFSRRHENLAMYYVMSAGAAVCVWSLRDSWRVSMLA